jgi:hypothetical protein
MAFTCPVALPSSPPPPPPPTNGNVRDEGDPSKPGFASMPSSDIIPRTRKSPPTAYFLTFLLFFSHIHIKFPFNISSVS